MYFVKFNGYVVLTEGSIIGYQKIWENLKSGEYSVVSRIYIMYIVKLCVVNQKKQINYESQNFKEFLIKNNFNKNQKNHTTNKKKN